MSFLFDVLIMLITGLAGGVAGAMLMEAHYQRRDDNKLVDTYFEEKEHRG